MLQCFEAGFSLNESTFLFRATGSNLKDSLEICEKNCQSILFKKCRNEMKRLQMYAFCNRKYQKSEMQLYWFFQLFFSDNEVF